MVGTMTDVMGIIVDTSSPASKSGKKNNANQNKDMSPLLSGSICAK